MKPDRVIATLLICLLGLLNGAALSAQGSDRTILQFAHTAWGAKEGAPKSIHAITQTKDGYLWLGSVDGLFQFDGVRFEHYQPQSGPSLPAGAVRSLLALSNGDLWIGFYSGAISLLRDGRAQNYTTHDGVPEGKVWSLAQDRDGTLWAGTNSGLARFESNRWKQVGSDWNYPGRSVNTLFLDHKGTLWVATEDSLVFLPRGARTFQSTSIRVGQVLQITEAANGKLWMAETTRAVRPVPLGNKLPPADETELIPGSQGILFARDGDLWITSLGNGMRRVPAPERLNRRSRRISGAIESYLGKDGLTDDVAISIYQDSEDNIWVGTSGGLDRFRKSNLVPLALPVLHRDPILVPGDDADVWAFLRERAFHIGKSRTEEVDNPSSPVDAAYRDSAGALWWLTFDHLIRFENGKPSRYPLPKELTRPFFYAMCATQDRSGTLWLAAEREGLFHRENGIWSRFNTPPDLAKLTPTTAFTDELGRAWFGYVGGTIIIVNEGNIQTVSTSLDSPIGDVWSIQGQSRKLWVAGAFGLAFFDGRKFQTVVPTDEKRFSSISGIEELDDGSLWLGEARGVIHIDAEEVRKFLATPSFRVHYELYDSLDGLGTFKNTGQKVVEGTDGRLWFGAIGGVGWLNPAHISRAVQPRASIRSLIADTRQFGSKPDLMLPPRTGNLQIEYTAVNLSNPERVRYRYQLEGTDKGWQDAGTRREAFYTNLSPGEHRFRVNARNVGEGWNTVEAVLDFRIAPAWFQTYWFRSLCGLSGIFIVWIIYRLRVLQISRAITARFDERLAERTRMARDLHDTFLQTIQGSKLVADHALKPSTDPVQMRGALEQLSLWLGRATQEGRAALNSLRTATAQTSDLTEALRRVTKDDLIPSSMAVTFSVVGDAREMHPIVRDEIYRIAYEAIRNACVHSGASQLEVELRYGHDLALRVSDNGVGIDPVIADKGRGGHFGLQGMRERAARIAGNLTLGSSSNSGTEIKLVVPGDIVFRKVTAVPRTLLTRIKDLLKRVGRTSKAG